MSPAAVRENRLALANFWVAVAAFALGAIMAVMQALSRADIDVPLRSPKVYYLSVTAHGVLMGLVFTTFFIMALGYVFTRQGLGRLVTEKWGWASFWASTFGTVMAAAAILSGTSTVLYTFYPPLQAHPTFYIGATLLIVGSWLWCAVMIRSAWTFKRENPGKPLPLSVHGMLATVIVWLLATVGVAAEALLLLIPWSLGWVRTVDPVLARTLFWWFGHPLTYFWLIPAYVIWYTVAPKVAGGKLFSDQLTRMVFMLFVLFSTPVGFHHQFTDPGISANWKLVHTFTTYAVMFPSLVTAFTVIASFEVAARMKGARGLFNWIGRLPWKDPLFASVAMAMLAFAVGGFGGAINAAYAMNTMVRNTAWIMGHFHLTVGTAVALTFMGASYWLLPRLTHRDLWGRGLATVQPYLWFVGMLLFGVVNHITGVMGMPRRVYSAAFQGAEQALAWESMTAMSAVGGIVLFVSSGMYLLVLIGTMLWGRPLESPRPIELAEPLGGAPERTGLWDRFGLWTVAAIALIVIAYALPLEHLLSMERFGSRPFKPF